MVHFYNVGQCTQEDGASGRCHALERDKEKAQLLSLPSGHLAMITHDRALIQYVCSVLLHLILDFF